MSTDAGLQATAREDTAGPDRTRLATLSLHISAVLYLVCGALLALVPLAWDPETTGEYALRSGVTWFLAVLCVALAALAWAAVRGLRRARRWAFRTALVLFLFYLPSIFLPLGAVGLFGLLSEGTRARFPKDRVSRRA